MVNDKLNSIALTNSNSIKNGIYFILDSVPGTAPGQGSRRQTRNIGQYEEIDMDTVQQMDGDIYVNNEPNLQPRDFDQNAVYGCIFLPMYRTVKFTEHSFFIQICEIMVLSSRMAVKYPK